MFVTTMDSFEIAPPGFEPGSQAPKARILDRCTMGLSNEIDLVYF